MGVIPLEVEVSLLCYLEPNYSKQEMSLPAHAPSRSIYPDLRTSTTIFQVVFFHTLPL